MNYEQNLGMVMCVSCGWLRASSIYLKFLSIVIHGLALHGLTPTYYGLRSSLNKTVSISLKQKQHKNNKTLAYRYWLLAGSLLEFSQMSFNLSLLSFQISECPSISLSLLADDLAACMPSCSYSRFLTWPNCDKIHIPKQNLSCRKFKSTLLKQRIYFSESVT